MYLACTLKKISLVRRVRDELLPLLYGFLTADVQVTHGRGQTLLQEGLVDVEQPHDQSPHYPCHHSKPILALSRLPLPFLLSHAFGIVFLVDILNQCNDDATEQVQVDLIIDGRLLPKNDTSHNKTRNHTIKRSLSERLSQQDARSLITENESPQFLAVLPGIPNYGLNGLRIEGLEEKGHDERVHKPYPASVFQPIPESLEDGEGGCCFILHAGGLYSIINQLIQINYCVIMAKRTKKVGVTGKYGTRYGSSIRKIVKKFELQQRAKYVCPACGKSQIRRTAAGIWACKGCKVTFAGGAFEFATSVATTAKVTMTRLKKLKEELNNANKDEEEKKETKETKKEKKAKAPKAPKA